MPEGLAWHPHPDVWALMLLLLGGYIYAVTVLGPRFAPVGTPPATGAQKAWFLSGLIVMWIASDAPIHDISESRLFSVHMVQHMLLTLVAPAMMLLGMPAWLLRKILATPGMFKTVRFLTKPIVAFLIFNTLVAVTHWPVVVNTSVNNELFHFTVHVLIVGSAFIMWWPVIDPLPELRRLSEPVKMLYLFGQSILPTVPASFLTFAERPLYSSYASFPRMWGLSPETDQMIAGLIMKLGGGLLLWAVIAVVFFKWYAKEESPRGPSMGWDDFERSLDAWDLRRT